MPRPRSARIRSPRKRLRPIRVVGARVSSQIAHGCHLFWRTPVWVRLVATLAAVAALWAAANWMVQVWRKPTEMFFPIGQALVKSPASTWREYGPLFREHSTPVMTAELLAALAQVEGAGNPVATPQWTWRWSRNPFEWYRPASS